MIEVADMFRRFAADYLSAHGASMLPSHRRAIEDPPVRDDGPWRQLCSAPSIFFAQPVQSAYHHA